MSWLPFVFSRAASFRARWSKRREDGRIIVFIARLFSKSYAETRDRTGDLQIFSLTLSQLSYRGGWALTWCGPVGSLLALSESPENDKLKSPEQLARSRIPLAPSNSNCGSEGLSIATIG